MRHGCYTVLIPVVADMHDFNLLVKCTFECEVVRESSIKTHLC